MDMEDGSGWSHGAHDLVICIPFPINTVILIGFLDTGRPLRILLCHPGWTAMVQSQLTAASTSWVQMILLPQPPDSWDYRHHSGMSLLHEVSRHINECDWPSGISEQGVNESSAAHGRQRLTSRAGKVPLASRDISSDARSHLFSSLVAKL
ncbi:hypothetical protein AAY473_009692 [Plecturocebus cupreus]